MSTQYRCDNERRQSAVRHSTTINGIEYLEVSPDEKTLKVFFIHSLPGQPNPVPPSASALTKNNVVITGGVRVKNVRVQSVSAADNILTVNVDTPGDYSTYTLRVVKSPTEPTPPDHFDPQLSEIKFSFKVDCPSDFDCKSVDECPGPKFSAPRINYLAKDYASFRRLMLDRLALIMPEWKERNAADVGIALVELLAYAADHLSYYQDAVATEAYLDTARRRVSLRRHARLIDYFTHDGANARAWVFVQVNAGSAADGTTLLGPTKDKPGTQLLTKVEGLPIALDAERLSEAVSLGAEVFETMHDVTLRAAHNEIRFYTWGDEKCCLPKGATRATLREKSEGGTIQLMPGSVLSFEEVRGPESGWRVDSDPSHRHVVRLTNVFAPTTDKLFTEGSPPQPISVVEIEWAPEDALPFPLCLWDVEEEDSPGSKKPVSIARANVVLVDHGRTLPPEDLDPIPEDEDICIRRPAPHYRPSLKFAPVTHQGRVRDPRNAQRFILFDPQAPAAEAQRWDLRDVQPAVTLFESAANVIWKPQRDLLSSDRFASDFVVEMEDDGRAQLRFGDGVLGRKPMNGLKATYRVGNGRAGNVGAEAIAHVIIDPARVAGGTMVKAGINQVCNPLPAQGGTEPEHIDQVRLYAPQAFRTQERAVTEADYATVAQRHPEVQKVAATRRWSGSWYTMFVTVDRKRGQPVDAAFKKELRGFLERFRLAGYDLEVEAPLFVPLDIVLTVCLEQGYFRSNVKKALLKVFSKADLPDGTRGFFHPDNLTFGQPIYLSQVIAVAMKVPGVAWVDVTRFQRWRQNPPGEIDEGAITFGRLEIPRLDNDPNAPENGKIDFVMQGGL